MSAFRDQAMESLRKSRLAVAHVPNINILASGVVSVSLLTVQSLYESRTLCECLHDGLRYSPTSEALTPRYAEASERRSCKYTPLGYDAGSLRCYA